MCNAEFGPDGGGRVMVLTPATGSTLARAGRPQHLKRAFTFNEHAPADRFRYFGIRNVWTDSDTAVILLAGTIGHFISRFTVADGQTKQAGLFWHSRNADRRLNAIRNDVSSQLRKPRAWSCTRECRE